MDDGLLMGYTIQMRISWIYFRRSIESMKKPQSLVMNLPLETEIRESATITVGV